MNMPGFTAEVSFYRAGRRYRSRQATPAQDRVVPAFPWDPPQINVSYQAPQPPLGEGFPGTLVITGENFAPDAEVTVTADNCSGAFHDRTQVHTSPSFDYCPNPLFCRHYFGGEFSATIPCFCGGASSVTANDTVGNFATGAADLPC